MAESLLLNGRLYTLDPARPWAEALLVRDGRIAAVGSVEDVRAAAPPGVATLDLGGRLALPGFIDAHNHFASTAEMLAAVDLRSPGVQSLAEVLLRVQERARQVPPGQWVRGFGLNPAQFPEGRWPTRWDLDRVSEEHPVVIHHSSGHYVLVNSLVLEQRGLSDDTPDPPGGQFLRDERGRLNGWCLDAATSLALPAAVDVGRHGPNFHDDVPTKELAAALGEGSRVYLREGLTTVCDPQVTRRELRAYLQARREGALGPRVACMPLSHALERLDDLGFGGPFGDDRLWLSGIKLYCDGSLTGGTAVFSEPYGARGEFAGTLYWSEDELAALVLRAHRAGWQVGIHSQGDRALEITLNAIEAALRVVDRPDPRPRIEHAGFPTPAQVRRMRTLDVAAINQPAYLFEYGDLLHTWLGPRAHRLQPWREELEEGVRVVLSSDAFVSSYRPLDALAAALERRTRDGVALGAEQALTLEEAIKAHTLDAAHAIGMEDRLGSLAVGKLADVVVLETDLFRASTEEIRRARVWLTLLGGEVAYRVS